MVISLMQYDFEHKYFKGYPSLLKFSTLHLPVVLSQQLHYHPHQINDGLVKLTYF